MSKVNLGRVVLGGVLAGLLINVSEFVLNGFVVAADMEAAMRARNLPPLDNMMVIWFVVLGFLLGIATVWAYAAIRSRFGPGVRTAATAGVFVWLLGYVYPNVGMGVIDVFPARLLIIVTCWGLPEIIIASIAGAWAYTEA